MTQPTVNLTAYPNTTLNLFNETLGSNESFILTQSVCIGSSEIRCTLRDAAQRPLLTIMTIRQRTYSRHSLTGGFTNMTNTSGQILLTGSWYHTVCNMKLGSIYM